MTETRVPGVSAKHTVITDECRAIHGDGGAFNRAAVALLSEFDSVTQQRGDEKGIRYHLVLTVEDTKPSAKRPTEVLSVVKDPVPYLTQAQKDDGCDGK